MVHKTFLNLPPEKRERIINSAIDEFGEWPYEKTNINRIIRNAGIPKGSFYQYFDDKDDLYTYCITLICRTALDAHLQDGRSILDNGMRRADRIGIANVTGVYSDEVRAIIGERSYQVLQGLVKAPRRVRNVAMLEIATTLLMPEMKKALSEDGQVCKDIDLDYYAYLMSVAEMVALEYANLRGIEMPQITTYTYLFMRAVYQAMLTPGGSGNG